MSTEISFFIIRLNFWTFLFPQDVHTQMLKRSEADDLEENMHIFTSEISYAVKNDRKFKI